VVPQDASATVDGGSRFPGALRTRCPLRTSRLGGQRVTKAGSIFALSCGGAKLGIFWGGDAPGVGREGRFDFSTPLGVPQKAGECFTQSARWRADPTECAGIKVRSGGIIAPDACQAVAMCLTYRY
jgi:hypothetical protein